LKFFEERDAAFGDYQGPVQPTLDPLGLRRYEIALDMCIVMFLSMMFLMW
jgi:hypothetical protein